MRKISTNITLDPKLKKESTYMLKEMGLDLSTFVSLSLKAMLNENGLPFKVKANCYKPKYGKVFKSIIAEAEDMEKHPEKYKTYNTVDELFEDLNVACKK